jgi:hypothetical protein
VEPKTFSSVTLEAEHVPDYVHAPLNNPGEGGQELPGEVRVYVVIDGARLLLDTLKASTVFEAQEVAQAKADAAQADTDAQADAQTAQAGTGSTGGSYPGYTPPNPQNPQG